MARLAGTTRPMADARGRPGLAPDEAEEARRVGERLQAEMAALIRSLPVGARTIAGMSGWLGVTRPICQRLVRASRRRSDALAALTFFPGVRGLYQVLEAARRRGIAEGPIESARAAVDRYAALIDRHGGSQKRLIAVIEQTPTGPSGAEVAGGARPGSREPLESPRAVGAARELAFRGIKAITRRSFETQFLLQIYQPQSAPGGDPLKMDALSIMGMLGVTRHPGSLPICPMSRYAFGGAEAAAVPIQAGPTPADGPVTLLEPFCSTPLPRVVAKPGAGSTPVLVDPDSDGGGPFDVVLGMKARDMANPAAVGSDSRVQICSLVSDGPARNLVMVALLHRSLARATVPTAAAIAVGRRGPVDLVPGNLPEDRWFDRLPERPAVEVLGQGGTAIHAASLPACPRLGELAERLIRSQGWAVDEFVGFRVSEAFPVWGAEYLISFGFESE